MARYCENCEHYVSTGKDIGFCNKSFYDKPVKKAKDTCKDHHMPGEFHHSGCFITTAVVKMLGYADDSKEMQNLRKIRSYMNLNPEYQKLLVTYDVIGPIIAENLIQNERFDLAEELFIYYIAPCSNLVEDGNYERAMHLYEEMIIRLSEQLGIDTYIPEAIIKDYKNKSKALGHGKVLVKKFDRTNK